MANKNGRGKDSYDEDLSEKYSITTAKERRGMPTFRLFPNFTFLVNYVNFLI